MTVPALQCGVAMPSGLCARLSGFQGEHPLHIPGHGHKAPFAAHIVQAAQQKLAESQHGFYDAEDRLGHALALGVELFAFGRLQTVSHGFNRVGFSGAAGGPANRSLKEG